MLTIIYVAIFPAGFYCAQIHEGNFKIVFIRISIPFASDEVVQRQINETIPKIVSLFVVVIVSEANVTTKQTKSNRIY